MKERTLFSVIAIFSLITGVLYFYNFSNNFYPDSESYIGPAQQLLSGHGFKSAIGLPETLRTPGYPLILAIFALKFNAVLIAQHILRIMLILATVWFVLRALGKWTALATGILMGFDFTLLESANAVLSDMIFTALFAVALWLLWKERFALSALMASIAAMIRPIGLVVIVPALIFILITRKTGRLKHSITFVLICVSLPALWSYRNWHDTGNFIFSAAPQADALLYRAPGGTAMDRGGDFRSNMERASAEACQEMMRQFSHPCSAETLTYHPSYYSQTALHIAEEHPFGMLKSTIRGTAVMMLDGGPTTISALFGTTWAEGMRAMLVYTVPMFFLSLIGLVKLWHSNRRLFILSVLVIAAFIIVSAGTGAYGRYRMPFIEIYLMAAGIGVTSVLRSIYNALPILTSPV